MAASCSVPHALVLAAGCQRKVAPALQSSFIGSSVASCSYRPSTPLLRAAAPRAGRQQAAVFCSAKAPWDGAPPAR